MNSKVVKSMFMLIISFIFASLCVTFAWFTGLRIQEVQGGNINLGNVIGELYYYNGNYNLTDPSKQPADPNSSSSSSEDDGIEWSGYQSDKEQLHRLTDEFNGNKPAFSKYTPGTFKMNDARPSSRYLFYIKAKSNHNQLVNIKLNIDNWTSNSTFTDIGNQTGEIHLTQAMYMYTNASENGSAQPLKSATQQQYDVEDARMILTWADELVVKKNNPMAVYNQNRFNQTGANNEESTGNLKPPVTIGKWNNIANDSYYLYPFIVEFTNDIHTYYKLDSQTHVYTKYTDGVPRAGYNSNIYAGLNFQIKQISLTQMDDLKPNV